MERVFTRETQIDLAFTIVGTLAAGALGLISLRTPVIAAGGGLLLLAVGLLLVMPERHFSPTPRGDRESFAHMRAQLVAGLDVARSRSLVRVFLLVSLLVGLSSEAFDRLWRVRILDAFPMPDRLRWGRGRRLHRLRPRRHLAVAARLARGQPVALAPTRRRAARPARRPRGPAPGHRCRRRGGARQPVARARRGLAAQRGDGLQPAHRGHLAQPQPRPGHPGHRAVDERAGRRDRPGRRRSAARRPGGARPPSPSRCSSPPPCSCPPWPRSCGCGASPPDPRHQPGSATVRPPRRRDVSPFGRNARTS